MPYLHWEHTLANAQINLLIESIREDQSQSPRVKERKQASKDISALPCSFDEKLLRQYLNGPEPMHIRRSLHTYFYRGLREPSIRDPSQIVDRCARRKLKRSVEGPPMLMVDQL